jgi:hypothetical protein
VTAAIDPAAGDKQNPIPRLRALACCLARPVSRGWLSLPHADAALVLAASREPDIDVLDTWHALQATLRREIRASKKAPFPPRPHQKRASRGLVATVARLAENLEARLGRPVSDEELARSLAMNVAHIRRARPKSGSVPQ